MIKCFSKISIAALFIVFSLKINCQVLNVQQVIQEHDQWCWAAVSKCIINYYGYSVSQCQVAEYTRLNATWHDFGSYNCCTNPNMGCNYWNYNYGATGSIENILEHWNIQNYGVANALLTYEIFQEISAHHPFLIRWGWTSGGGHFVVGHGLSGNTLYYMNPWPGEGLKMADYSWVVSSNEHTWTHTNVITTYHSAINEDVEALNTINIYPNPAEEILNINNNSGSAIVCHIKTITGQTLSTFTLENEKESIDLHSLDKGFYFLVIESGEYTVCKKFIKI